MDWFEQYKKADPIDIQKEEKISFDHLFKPSNFKCKCGWQLNKMNKVLVCEKCGFYEIIHN